MKRYERLGRRSFISQVGTGVMGVVVLGSAAACSDDGGLATGSPDSNGTTTPPAESAPTTAAATDPPSTTDVASTAAPATTPSEGGAVAVERVDLGFVSAYLLVRNGEVAIVDTGVSGSDPAIAESLAAVGLSWNDVGHVILTHLHRDHIGSLGAVMNAATDAIGYAGEADIPGISSPRPLTPIGTGDQVLGLDIISTPGHTPGHISVFDPLSRALVTGDAINGAGSGLGGAEETGVAGPNPDFTADMAQAQQSVALLADLAPDAIYFGHGRPLLDGAAAAISTLAGS